MTTIRERSTAALAEALEATVDLDPTTPVAGGYAEAGSVYLNWNDVLGAASTILAASPTLARRLDLGTAWDEAVAALPEGWFMYGVRRFFPNGDQHYRATAYGETGDVGREDGYGPTPTEALVALTAALRERQP